MVWHNKVIWIAKLRFELMVDFRRIQISMLKDLPIFIMLLFYKSNKMTSVFVCSLL